MIQRDCTTARKVSRPSARAIACLLASLFLGPVVVAPPVPAVDGDAAPPPVPVDPRPSARARAERVQAELDARLLEFELAWDQGLVQVVDGDDPGPGVGIEHGRIPTRLRSRDAHPEASRTNEGSAGPPPAEDPGPASPAAPDPEPPAFAIPTILEPPRIDRIGNDPLNLAPLAPIHAPAGPSEGFTGIPYTFSTSAVDPDNDPVVYEFSWGDGTNSTTGFGPSGSTMSSSHAWSWPGSYLVRARAADRDGEAGPWSPSANITLVTRAPNTPFTPTGPTAGQTGIAQSFTFRGSDPDNDSVRFLVSWGDGSTSWTATVASGAPIAASHVYATPGTYEVKAQAEDQHGARSENWSAPASITLRSRPPVRPPAPGGPTTGLTGVPVSYTSSTQDPDQDAIRYTYEFFQGASPPTVRVDPTWRASGATSTISHTWTVPGTHAVRVKAEDIYGEHNGFSPNKSVTIRSRAPNATSTPSGPVVGETGVAYSYTVSASDPDNDAVRFQFAWGDNNTTWTGSVPSGANASASHAWSSPGTYAVSAIAQDSWGETGPVSPTLLVTLQSRPPGAPQILALPANGSTGVAYAVSFVADDPDGDAIRYQVQWQTGNLSWTPFLPSGATYNTSHVWLTPGTHNFSVRAEDAHGRSSSWSAPRTVEIRTRDPAVPAAPTGPVTPRTTRVENYTTRTSDPDGDSLRYQFEWNQAGSVTSNWTAFVPNNTNATMGRVWTAPGSHSVRTRAEDVHGAASGWSTALTTVVLSQKPNSFGAAGGPTAIQTGIEHSYSIATTDPDGDHVKYLFTWGDGAQEWTDFHPSGQTVSKTHTWTAPGSYNLSVLARDLHGESRTGTTLVVSVFSRGPLTPATPSGPAATPVALVARYTAQAIDPDGDDVRVLFDWGDGTTSWSDVVASGATVGVDHVWSTTGTKLVRVLAEDANGVQSSWSATLAVAVTNAAPFAPGQPSMDIVHFGAYGNSGTSYTFRGATDDPERHALRYRFDWGDGTFSPWGSTVPSGSVASASHAWSVSGAPRTFQVRLQAEDEHGAGGSWSAGFPVLVYPVNTAPNATGAPVGPAVVVGSLASDLTFRGTDPHADRLRYHVDWGDGTSSVSDFVANGDRATLSHAWPSTGTYSVTARAEDHRGLTGPAGPATVVKLRPAVLLTDAFEDGAISPSIWDTTVVDPAVRESGGDLRIYVDQVLPLARKSLVSQRIVRDVAGDDGLRVTAHFTAHDNATSLGYVGVRVTNADRPTDWAEIRWSGSQARLRDSLGTNAAIRSATGTASAGYILHVDGNGWWGMVENFTNKQSKASTIFEGATAWKIELVAGSDSTTTRSEKWTARFHDVVLASAIDSAPPTTTYAPTGPTAGTTDNVLRLNLKGLDPDSTPLRFEVDWADGTTSLSHWFVYSEASTNLAYADHQWSTTGSKAVKARTIDTAGLAAASLSAAKTVTISLPNLPPSVPETPAGPTDGTTSTTYTFTSFATDPNPGTTLTYEFHWGDSAVSTVSRTSGTTASASHSWALPGSYPVAVKVRDPAGEARWSDARYIDLRSKAPGTPAAPTHSPTSPTEAGSVTLQARVVDGDGDEVWLEWEIYQAKYDYTWFDGSGPTASNVYQTITYWGLERGHYKARVRGYDVWGEVGPWSAWHGFDVTPPPAPAQPPYNPWVFGETDGWRGTAYFFYAAAEDVNGGNLVFEFDWGDGTPKDLSDPVPPGQYTAMGHAWNDAGVPAGQSVMHTVRVRARDSGSLWSGWTEHTIWLSPMPGTPSQAPGTPAQPDGRATVLPNVYYEYSTQEPDPQGDWVYYIFYWGDGTEDYSGLVPSNERVSMWHAWPHGETFYNVRTQAVDEWGNHGPLSTYRTVTVSHVPNDPPNLPDPATGPSTVRVDDSIALTFRVVDPDGDLVRHFVDWGDGSMIDVTNLEASGASIPVPHSYRSPGRYYVTMWAEDVHQNVGESRIVKSVMVEDHPAGQQSALFESFENGWNGWAHTGDWDLAAHAGRVYTGWWALHFGQDILDEDDRTYAARPDPNVRNTGIATSPLFTVPTQNPTLLFRQWYEVDILSNSDLRKVHIVGSSGAILYTTTLPKNNDRVWHSVTLPLASWAGQQVRVRFEFDTVDGRFNNYEGWYIDRVEVYGIADPGESSFVEILQSDVLIDEVGLTSNYVSRPFDGEWDDVVFVNGGEDHVTKTIRVNPEQEMRNAATFRLEVFGKMPSCLSNPTSGRYEVVANTRTTQVDLCPLAPSTRFDWIPIVLDRSYLRNGYNTFQLRPLQGAGQILLPIEHESAAAPGDPSYGAGNFGQERSDIVIDGVEQDGELVWRLAADRQQDAFTITWTITRSRLVAEDGSERLFTSYDAVAYFADEERDSLRVWSKRFDDEEVRRGWSSTIQFEPSKVYWYDDITRPYPHAVPDPGENAFTNAYAKPPVQGKRYAWYEVEAEAMDVETGAAYWTRYVQLVERDPPALPPGPTYEKVPTYVWDDWVDSILLPLRGYIKLGLCDLMGLPGGPHQHRVSDPESDGNPHGLVCLDLRLQLLSPDFLVQDPATEQAYAVISEVLEGVNTVFATSVAWTMADAPAGTFPASLSSAIDGALTALDITQWYLTFAQTGDIFRYTLAEYDRPMSFLGWPVGTQPFTHAYTLHPDPAAIVGFVDQRAGFGAAILSWLFQAYGWHGHHLGYWYRGNGVWEVGFEVGT